MPAEKDDIDDTGDKRVESTITKDDDDKGPPKKSNKKVNNKKKMASAGSSNSLIKKLHTQQDLQALISAHDAVVVEFMTSWCGACKGIEPLYEELASSHAESVQAAQVVCDKNRETKKLATAYGVSSYPVFVLFENGSTTGKWNGADRGKLETTFDRLGGGGKGRGGRKKKGR
jgi:thiol-disulfide isomerase/thioredoxin